jgi:hypothetical protein
MISGKTAELQTPPQGSLSVYIDRGDYRASPPLSLCVSAVDGNGIYWWQSDGHVYRDGIVWWWQPGGGGLPPPPPRREPVLFKVER